jgi:hypothetical protein
MEESASLWKRAKSIASPSENEKSRSENTGKEAAFGLG